MEAPKLNENQWLGPLTDLSVTSELRTYTATLLLACVTLVLIRTWRDRHARGLKIKGKNGWGAVYVLQSRKKPSVFKVGVTRRPVSLRRKEIVKSMSGGHQLKILMVLEAPQARAIEHVMHRRLRRHRYSDRHHKGREWFLLSGVRRKRRIEHLLRASASDVRRLARRKRCWPTRLARDATLWKAGQLSRMG